MLLDLLDKQHLRSRHFFDAGLKGDVTYFQRNFNQKDIAFDISEFLAGCLVSCEEKNYSIVASFILRYNIMNFHDDVLEYIFNSIGRYASVEYFKSKDGGYPFLKQRYNIATIDMSKDSYIDIFIGILSTRNAAFIIDLWVSFYDNHIGHEEVDDIISFYLGFFLDEAVYTFALGKAHFVLDGQEFRDGICKYGNSTLIERFVQYIKDADILDFISQGKIDLLTKHFDVTKHVAHLNDVCKSGSIEFVKFVLNQKSWTITGSKCVLAYQIESGCSLEILTELVAHGHNLLNLSALSRMFQNLDRIAFVLRLTGSKINEEAYFANQQLFILSMLERGVDEQKLMVLSGSAFVFEDIKDRSNMYLLLLDCWFLEKNVSNLIVDYCYPY